MSRVRKVLNSVAGLAFLAWIFYFGYSFVTAEARVRALCDDVLRGSSLAQLSEFAQMHGLSRPRASDGMTFLVETRTFGRYGCRVTMTNGHVQKAEYNFLD